MLHKDLKRNTLSHQLIELRNYPTANRTFSYLELFYIDKFETLDFATNLREITLKRQIRLKISLNDIKSPLSVTFINDRPIILLNF